jgi:hypothetical protein
MIASRNRYLCGLSVLSSDSPDTDGFASDVAREAAEIDAGFALVFFSQKLVHAEELALSLAHRAPALRHAGCSTAGEITPLGMQDGQMLAILFPSAHFQVATAMIRNLSGSGVDAIAADVCAIRRSLLATSPHSHSSNIFALSLIDGMSRTEEAFTAAVNWGLDDIPLIGGSAGDDFQFRTTKIICDGVAETDCAVVVMMATDVPFHVFKTTNYVPSDEKLVVTASDPDRRIVYEFNAAPAVTEFASAVGLPENDLTPLSLASHPVGVSIGGEYYCRSVQAPNADGSLAFACAIDDGVVLSIARPVDMVQSAEDALDDVRDRIGNIDVVIGFDCALRRLDAANRQVTRELSDAYRRNNVVGFNTYGEQFRAMHLNQTLTGIAFGRKLAAE